MPIYDQSFRRYDGPRSTRGLWRVVAWNTLRPIFKSKLAGLILIALIIQVTIYSFGLFIGAKLEEVAQQHTEQATAMAVEQDIPLFRRGFGLNTLLFNFIGQISVLIWLLLLVTGGASVSSDLRNASLPLYFSRPLRPQDYIVGKVMGLAAAPAVVTSLAVLIVYLQAVAYHYPTSDLWLKSGLLIKAFAYATMTSVFVSLLIVAFSSACRKASTAAVTFFGFFVLTHIVSQFAERRFRYPDAAAISPARDLLIVLVKLLNPKMEGVRRSARFAEYDLSVVLLVLAAYALLAFLLIRRNLKVVEVVK